LKEHYIMNAFGPSFAAELSAAGVGGLPFAWMADGTINYSSDITAQQRATIEAVRSAHNPVRAGLIAYAAVKQKTIAGGGVSVNINIGSAGAPVMISAATDVAGLVLLQGAAAIAGANGAATFDWVVGAAATKLTAAQITAIFAAVSAFIQSTFTVRFAILGAINAGTITTPAQVDAPPLPLPAWPVNS
jgi:hypothetical protein